MICPDAVIFDETETRQKEDERKMYKWNEVKRNRIFFKKIAHSNAAGEIGWFEAKQI